MQNLSTPQPWYCVKELSLLYLIFSLEQVSFQDWVTLLNTGVDAGNQNNAITI